jgi:hypothetical protein
MPSYSAAARPGRPSYMVRRTSSKTVYHQGRYTLSLYLPGCTIVPAPTMGSLALTMDMQLRHELGGQRRELTARYGSSAPERRPSAGQQGLASDRVLVADRIRWTSWSRQIGSGASRWRFLVKRSTVEVLPYTTSSCALLHRSLLRQGGSSAHSGQRGVYVDRKKSMPDWSSRLLCIQNGTKRRMKKERYTEGVRAWLVIWFALYPEQNQATKEETETYGTFHGRRKRRTDRRPWA